MFKKLSTVYTSEYPADFFKIKKRFPYINERK